MGETEACLWDFGNHPGGSRAGVRVLYRRAREAERMETQQRPGRPLSGSVIRWFSFLVTHKITWTTFKK